MRIGEASSKSLVVYCAPTPKEEALKGFFICIMDSSPEVMNERGIRYE